MNKEIKNEINVSRLDEKIISNNTKKKKGQAEELVHGKTRAEWIRILGTVPDMQVEKMTKEEMIALTGNVPLFLDDDGPSDILPSFITTVTSLQLFGELLPGETVAEAALRKSKDNFSDSNK